jgi:hypothetical protein
MAAKIIGEVNVGLTVEIEQGLKIACEHQGVKPSQYMRQAGLMRLINEGYMVHPMQQKAAAQQQQNAAQ